MHKNLRIKSKVERRKAKSRRAIQAYWLAKFKEARVWVAEAEDELEDAYDDIHGCLKHDPTNWYGYDWHVEQAQCKLRAYDGVLTNARCRYQHAIPR